MFMRRNIFRLLFCSATHKVVNMKKSVIASCREMPTESKYFWTGLALNFSSWPASRIKTSLFNISS